METHLKQEKNSHGPGVQEKWVLRVGVVLVSAASHPAPVCWRLRRARYVQPSQPSTKVNQLLPDSDQELVSVCSDVLRMALPEERHAHVQAEPLDLVGYACPQSPDGREVVGYPKVALDVTLCVRDCSSNRVSVRATVQVVIEDLTHHGSADLILDVRLNDVRH